MIESVYLSIALCEEVARQDFHISSILAKAVECKLKSFIFSFIVLA